MKPLFQDVTPVATNPLAQQPSYAIAPQQPTAVAVLVSESDVEKLGASNASRSASTTQQILASVRASDTEAFGAKLNELVATAKKLDPNKMGKPGLISKLLGLGGNIKEKMMAEYQTVESRMNALVAELDNTAALMSKRVDDLERMFTENYQTHQALEADVARGNELLIGLEAHITSLGTPADAFGAQTIADLTARANRLRKRIDDLERGMQLAKLAAPEIRMQQAHNRALVSAVNDIKVTTIPAWQGVFSRYIIAMEAKRGAELINNVYDATDAAFRMQADALRQNTQEIARAQQRSVVTTDTLVHMQQQLIGAVDDALKIEQEGRAQREAARPKLKQLETDLIQRFAPQTN